MSDIPYNQSSKIPLPEIFEFKSNQKLEKLLEAIDEGNLVFFDNKLKEKTIPSDPNLPSSLGDPYRGPTILCGPNPELVDKMKDTLISRWDLDPLYFSPNRSTLLEITNYIQENNPSISDIEIIREIREVDTKVYMDFVELNRNNKDPEPGDC